MVMVKSSIKTVIFVPCQLIKPHYATAFLIMHAMHTVYFASYMWSLTNIPVLFIYIQYATKVR